MAKSSKGKKVSGGTAALKAARQGESDFSAGPRTSSRAGQGKVGEKKMASTADLPKATLAMKAPPADIPEVANKLAAQTLPVETNIDKVSNVGWDYMRDQKLKEVK